jgi:predicted HTH transcriptional regulator
MNYRDVDQLLEEGEGFTLELKRKVSTPEKIGRALTAFANTRGGMILFGVDDDGSVVGVESEKTEIELIHTAATVFVDPPLEPVIEIVSYKGRDLIAVTVGESAEKPHAALCEKGNGDEPEWKVFIRVNDKTVLASREVERILRSESPGAPPLRIAIGESERRLFDYLERNERITVKEFGKLVNVSDRRSSRLLIQLVRAGVLRIHTTEKEDFFTLAFK